MYANFGSLTVLTAAQLAEFAWGLAAMGRPFLCVVREDIIPGGGGRPRYRRHSYRRWQHGRVVVWCPQERVLRHRARLAAVRLVGDEKTEVKKRCCGEEG